MSEQRRPATTLIHHPYKPPAGFEAPQVGVHKASTVIFPNVAALRARNWKEKSGYTYGLHGTPTSFTLEERLATLEGGLRALLAPSGLAAIAMVDAALLSQGDEVLLPDNVYGPSREFALRDLARWGITHRLYDPLDAAAAGAMIGERTKLMWVEAAGSVTMEFPDLRGLVREARARGVTVALDNTWGAGLAFNAFDLGDGLAVDISVHALTKYPSGGGDVLMGSVVTRDEALHQRLMFMHMRLGFGVGGNDVEAVLRSLPSLPLRYAAHDASARRIAAWLQRQGAVSQLLHPAFDGSPGHAHWRALCTQAAGLFSVMLDPAIDTARVDAMLDALRLFRLGYSWGGPVSLAVPYNVSAMRDRPRHGGTLLRFAIGLEDPDDLIADLAQALRHLA